MAPVNNFMQMVNQNGTNLEVEAQIITLDDNLTHPYFSSLDFSLDQTSPIGTVKVEMPYTEDISNYWVKYNGVIVISCEISDLNRENTNSLNYSESYGINRTVQNDEYNYSFIGKLSRFKQQGKNFILYLEDLGWKFMQKVPSDFRAKYIAGQYCDDAFQAICEFLDVKFAYSIEDLHNFQFGADGFSIQKDGQLIEEVTTVLSEWQQPVEEVDPLDDPLNEEEGLLDYKKQNEDEENSQNNDDTSSEDVTVNENEDTSIEEKTIAFQEDFDNKILNLFIGNHYYDSDLTHPVMNYGNITVTPTTLSDSADAGMSAEGGNDSDAANGNSSQNVWSALSDILYEFYPRSTNKNGWIRQLKNCDTNWSSVASIVNKMGGDKDKQNTVVSKVLKIKKNASSNSKSGKNASNGSKNYKIYNTAKKMGMNAVKANDQEYKKTLQKMGIGSVTHWI